MPVVIAGKYLRDVDFWEFLPCFRKSVKLICPVSEIRHVEHPSGENVVGAVEQSHRTQVQVAIDIDYTEIIPPIYKDIDFYKNGLGIIQDFDDM